jgi:hypothetical protein
VKKGHISVRFLLITFFGAFLQNFFNGFKISVYSAFFDTHTEFLNKNIFLLLLALFVNFDCTCGGNSSKKRKIFFYECVLEFYLATNHQRVCITKCLFSAPLLLENRSQYEPVAVRHVLFM